MYSASAQAVRVPAEVDTLERTSTPVLYKVIAEKRHWLNLSDGSNYPRQGKFYFADRQVDIQTGSIRLAGLFPNPSNVLRPGQFGRIRFISYTRKGALLVPQKAVVELQGSYQVAVVGADNKVSLRTVQVGERSGAMWIVNQGLKPQERVVVEGVQKVRDSMQVNPTLVAASAEGN